MEGGGVRSEGAEVGVGRWVVWHRRVRSVDDPVQYMTVCLECKIHSDKHVM